MYNMTKLKRYMLDFSLHQLKRFLGENLVEMLIEWTPSNETLFPKNKIADMIAVIHGTQILSDRSFREVLLTKLRVDDILSFREFLGRNYRECTNLPTLISAIVSTPWRNNEVSNHLLKILDIDNSFLCVESTDEVAMEEIVAYDRFFELLDYQFVIRQKALAHLTSGVELMKMLIHMPTGTGKTKTAMHTIIHHYNFNLKKDGLIIWMAHTKELLEQAYETFHNVWKHIGNGSVTTYKLWGNLNFDYSEEPLNGFLFCGFQKLMSIFRNNPDLFQKLVRDCNLVIVDEAHKAVASETKNIINQIMIKPVGMKDRALIGLTATPGRSMFDDNDNDRLIAMFDNRPISIETNILNSINLSKFEIANTPPERDIIKYFQERKILARIKREKLTYDEVLTETELKKLKIQMTSNGYEDFDKAFLETVGRNKSRNRSILTKLLYLEREKVPTIVFACSVEHGQLLSAALTLEGINNACVFGNMSSIERATAIKRFKDREDDLNILINYEVLTTGFDATNIKCVFITRPTQSVVLYSQMLGRGLRGPKMGGNEECLLVDIEDNLERYISESMAFSYFNNYWNI